MTAAGFSGPTALVAAATALAALVVVLWPWWPVRRPPPERMSDQWRNRARRDEADR